ncbi:hypothetical protein ACSBR1_027707 [Camellia fascicularis]
MARPVFLLVWALVLLIVSLVFADVMEHSFEVKDMTLQRLCRNQVITAVNGGLPGPTILAHKGDTLVVHVFNKSPYNLTIHWHGIFQMLSAWADRPEYATQCPIRPRNSYTYIFNITGQEGTLWWHAHSQWLRATVYGALIIRPKVGHSYPFLKPYKEFPILLALASGGAPNSSNAFTINGQPDDLYQCSSNGTDKVNVARGKTYLLHIINATMNNQFFFKIANHKMTVIAVDATYTTLMVTDFIVIALGQTIDTLLTADQPPTSYYMAAHTYISSEGVPDATTSTIGIMVYENAMSSTPRMPVLPAFNDTPTAYEFYTSLTALVNAPHWVPVPLNVDEHMFVTVSLGLIPCETGSTCGGPLGERLAASLNNASFEFNTKLSMMEAFFNNVDGIYTTDFPDQPPLVFDYMNSNNFNRTIIMTSKLTKVKKLKFNSTVEMVLQNTASMGIES